MCKNAHSHRVRRRPRPAGRAGLPVARRQRDGQTFSSNPVQTDAPRKATRSLSWRVSPDRLKFADHISLLIERDDRISAIWSGNGCTSALSTTASSTSSCSISPSSTYDYMRGDHLAQGLYFVLDDHRGVSSPPHSGPPPIALPRP